MRERPNEEPWIRLDWWRFAVVATLSLSIMGLVASVGRQTSKWSPTLAMAVLGLSAVSFLAYRWHRLRSDVAAGHLTREVFYREPRAQILGPVLPLALWFVVTIMTMFTIVVLGAIRGF